MHRFDGPNVMDRMEDSTADRSCCERPGRVRVTGPQPPRVRPRCLSVAWPGWTVWVPGSELSVILPFIPLGQSSHRQEPQARATTLRVNVPLFSALSNTGCLSVQRQLGLRVLAESSPQMGRRVQAGRSRPHRRWFRFTAHWGADAHTLPLPLQPTSSSGLALLAQWWGNSPCWSHGEGPREGGGSCRRTKSRGPGALMGGCRVCPELPA